MARRRRVPTASEMPQLQESLTAQAVSLSAILDDEATPDDELTMRLLEQAVRDAELWWVTKPMAALAATAATSLIEWTPSLVRPARAGLIVWDGGTGIETRDALGRGLRAEIIGALWAGLDDGLVIATVMATPADVEAPAAHVWTSDVYAVDEQGVCPDEAGQRIWDLMGATWLLAQQATVGHTWGVRYDRRDPDRPFARPTMPGRITVVALREVARAEGGQDPGIDEGPRQSRQLRQRHLVRGHWRQQPCGPRKSLRRPVFVVPYVKGPADSELVVKPTVRVWRR